MPKARGAKFSYDSELVQASKQLKRQATKAEQWVETLLPAEAGAPKLTGEVNKRPLAYLLAAIALTSVVLALRLAGLQILHGNSNLNLANGNRIRERVTYAPRGLIYDRNHQILVNNVAGFDVTIVPSQLPRAVPEKEVLYARLGGLLGLPAADVKAKAEVPAPSSNQGVLIASNISRDQALLVDQDSTKLPGVSLDVNPIRQYADNSLSQFLGYVGRVSNADLKVRNTYLPTDYIGKLGIELQYEWALKGKNGGQQTEVDASGRPVRLLADQPARAGNNLTLTIDEGLQQKLTEALQKQAEAAHSPKAAAVAVNPKTGEVLAAISLPNYDNNLFAKGISSADYTKLLADSGQPLFNKAINGGYPSGSIIKPIVAAAALDERVVTPQTVIVDKGQLDIPNPYDPKVTYTFHGWEHSGLGSMNIFSALAMSSDIYFYTVAGGYGPFRGLGVGKLTSYYARFGLGQKTGIDLPEEASGRVPTPSWKQRVIHEGWYTGDTYNISVGQGDILVSPLQMAMATAAVANGGTLYKPYLVQQVTALDGQVVKKYQPTIVRSNLATPESLAIVRQGMRQAVQSGTACCVLDKEVSVAVAGKTGTAETDPGKRAPEAWFTSFAPYDDPKIVVVALVENAGEGAEYAVPAVRETLAWYFNNRPH